MRGLRARREFGCQHFEVRQRVLNQFRDCELSRIESRQSRQGVLNELRSEFRLRLRRLGFGYRGSPGLRFVGGFGLPCCGDIKTRRGGSLGLPCCGDIRIRRGDGLGLRCSGDIRSRYGNGFRLRCSADMRIRRGNGFGLRCSAEMGIRFSGAGGRRCGHTGHRFRRHGIGIFSLGVGRFGQRLSLVDNRLLRFGVRLPVVRGRRMRRVDIVDLDAVLVGRYGDQHVPVNSCSAGFRRRGKDRADQVVDDSRHAARKRVERLHAAAVEDIVDLAAGLPQSVCYVAPQLGSRERSDFVVQSGTLRQPGQTGFAQLALQTVFGHQHQAGAYRHARVGCGERLEFGERLIAEACRIFDDDEKAYALGMKIVEQAAEDGQFADRPGRHLLQSKLPEKEFDGLVGSQLDAADMNDGVLPAQGAEGSRNDRGLAAAHGAGHANHGIRFLERSLCPFYQRCRLRPDEHVVADRLMDKRAFAEAKVLFVHTVGFREFRFGAIASELQFAARCPGFQGLCHRNAQNRGFQRAILWAGATHAGESVTALYG